MPFIVVLFVLLFFWAIPKASRTSESTNSERVIIDKMGQSRFAIPQSNMIPVFLLTKETVLMTIAGAVTPRFVLSYRMIDESAPVHAPYDWLDPARSFV